MNVQDFVAEVKAKAAAVAAEYETVKTDLEAFFAAHPELEAPAIGAATAAIGDLASAASAEVEHVAPPSLAQAFDDKIAAVQKAADDQVAQIQAETESRVASLQAAREQVVPPAVAQ